MSEYPLSSSDDAVVPGSVPSELNDVIGLNAAVVAPPVRRVFFGLQGHRSSCFFNFRSGILAGMHADDLLLLEFCVHVCLYCVYVGVRAFSTSCTQTNDIRAHGCLFSNCL